MMTDGLVLRTWPYSESTLIASLLTRDLGVVRVVAKGARRLKGHTAAAFDLFSLIRGKVRTRGDDGLGSLFSVELKGEWMFLRSDLRRFAMASTALEVLGSVASVSVHEPYFFDEAIEYLTRLEDAEAPGSLTAWLLYRLLVHAGHPPRLDPSLPPGPLPEPLAYDFSESMIRATDPGFSGPERRYPLPRALVEQLAPLLAAPPLPLDAAPIFHGRAGAACLGWLTRIWEDHLGHPLQSLEFLEKTVLAAVDRGAAAGS